MENETKIIEYLKNSDENKICALLEQNDKAIKYIENPSEDMQILAVTQNGKAIKHIKCASKKVQTLALWDPNSKKYIENILNVPLLYYKWIRDIYIHSRDINYFMKNINNVQKNKIYLNTKIYHK